MAARVDCPKTTVKGPYPVVSTFTTAGVTLTAADATNFNSISVAAAPCVLLIFGGSAGGTYTIESAVDPQGRTGDLTTISIAANAIDAFYFPASGLAGWANSDGTVHIKGSVNTIKFGVVQLPG